MTQIQLQAGTYVTDITPPLEVGLLTSSVKGTYAPFESVRLPLKARVLVLQYGKEMVAIVSLDLLSLNDTSVGGWQHFKEALAGPIPAERIIVTCTHTHNAPESGALSELYLTETYRSWLMTVQHKINHAITQAAEALRPCQLSVASAKLEAHSLQRRIPTAAGIAMSDAMQPIAPALLLREPVDRRVHMLSLHGTEGDTIATIVHAICHPVHEMCMLHISPDFPGEMCIALEAAGEYGMPMFLNGAAGDINPPTVSLGPAHAREHGLALAALVQQKAAEAVTDTSVFEFIHAECQFAIRPGSGISNKEDALAKLNIIRIGELAIVFLPGEPFIELAYEIEKNSPFEHTIIVGYAENNIGYILTAAAFEQGGYESGPGKWSYLEKEAGSELCNEAIRLLHKLYHKETANYNVYEHRYKN
jgi:neutral ceramidase